MNHKIKERLPYLFIFLLLAAGIGFLAYPTVSDWLCRYTARAEIAGYNRAVEEEGREKLDSMLSQAWDYNKTLNTTGASSAVSYNDLLAVTDAIGYLEIPKIGVYLPIYHGTDETVMERGIGHLPETSLPVGGVSTHCVLSGHSGLPSAKILTRLDEMETGDLFYIHVLDETLAYEVDQIKTVLPEETQDIQIVEGKDYVTILTCVPYGINTHRLLVRGERTKYQPGSISVQAPEETQPEPSIEPGKLLLLGKIVLGTVLVLGTVCILLFPSKKKK